MTSQTTTSTKKTGVLYLDDEENNLVSFRAAYRRHFKVHCAQTVQEALAILRDEDIDIIVTDQRMPEMTGVEFLASVTPLFPDSIRMILTGYSDVESIIKAINTGQVFRYITKPWDEQELLITLNNAANLVHLQKRNKALLEELQDRVAHQERVMKLFQTYVPEDVVNEALSKSAEGGLLGGEVREVSVLFSDIRNFTAISEKLNPQHLVQMLNDYFSLMTDSIRAHQGTLNKFLGDGLLAIFGAPVASANHPQNAVLCALDMVERLNVFNQKYATLLGEEIRIGIGINSGEVVVGNIGSVDRVEYTAIGDAVNVSSRIEALTKDCPNAVLLSQRTHESVTSLVETKAWDPVYVKGKSDKLEVYQVMGRR